MKNSENFSKKILSYIVKYDNAIPSSVHTPIIVVIIIYKRTKEFMTLFWSFGQHCGGSLSSHHTIGEEQ
jgi:hypothetical protein